MMVTWVTLAYTNYSIVEYNKADFPLTLRASGGVTKFTDGGSEHRVLYIHRVKLTGLVPGQRYGMYGECTHCAVDLYMYVCHPLHYFFNSRRCYE